MDFPLSERIEAEVRRLMAAHAKLEPRGWVTQRERDALQRRIDDLLDELHDVTVIDTLEPEFAS